MSLSHSSARLDTGRGSYRTGTGMAWNRVMDMDRNNARGYMRVQRVEVPKGMKIR